jgi:S-(hydroxymethyl)glutathione dehydrogenase/alcohol dehydrogenase
MKTNAALLWSSPGKWEITEVELDPPRAGEVLVRTVAAGLCHSDDHVCKGDMPPHRVPMCGGHEGAGVVEALGGGIDDLAIGDHVVYSFVPSCGRCHWCASGRQSLCGAGATTMKGAHLDGTFRMHADGHDVSQMALIGSFAERTVVNRRSCVKIPSDMPLAEASLLSCGVPTGWGSAVVAADVRPGDVTIVMGVGGIGINAVQGAAHAGASRVIAVDPVEFKREMALSLGATDAFATMGEAHELAKELTDWQGAHSAIVAVGLTRADHVAEGFSAIQKGGTLVVTGISSVTESTPPINLFELAMWQKRIQGVIYGSLSPNSAVPHLVRLYQSGQLKLTELITRTYALDQINEGYDDMLAGRNIRGVITFN